MSKVIIVNVFQSIKLYLLCRYTLRRWRRYDTKAKVKFASLESIRKDVLLLLYSLQLFNFTLKPQSRSRWGLTAVFIYFQCLLRLLHQPPPPPRLRSSQGGGGGLAEQLNHKGKEKVGEQRRFEP